MCSKVAIIIVNWNGYNDTVECLHSIENLDYNDFKVFLVDNHSTDKSLEFLKDKIEKEKLFNFEVKLIANSKNLGFAGGNNVAIKQAMNQGFELMWLLNNDTVVEKRALSELVDTMDFHPSVGIVGSKILYYKSDKIWFAGGRVNTWTGRASHIGLREIDSEKFNETKEVDYITGCSLMFRSALIQNTGYMSEDYFLYYEETDWNLRAKQNGWKILFVPESRIYHKISIASGGEKNLAPYVAFYDIRNSYRMICRTQKSVLKKFTAYIYKFLKSSKKLMRIFVKNQDQKIVRVKYIFRGLFSS